MFDRSSWFLWHIILQNLGIIFKSRWARDMNLTEETQCIQKRPLVMAGTGTEWEAQIFWTPSWFVAEISMAGDVNRGSKEVVIIAVMLGSEKFRKIFQVWRTYLCLIIGVTMWTSNDFSNKGLSFVGKEKISHDGEGDLSGKQVWN